MSLGETLLAPSARLLDAVFTFTTKGICRPEGFLMASDAPILLAPRPLRLSFWVVSGGLQQYAGTPSFFGFSAYLRTRRKSRRADSNRLSLLQLRVIHQALQELAGICKSRIFRRLPLLRVAVCCTVLRSRWCQSGVKSRWTTCRRFHCKPDPRPEHSLFTHCACKDRKRPAATGSPDSVSRLYCAWITRFPSPYSDLEVNPG
jgi:hypothetical protein